MHIIGHVFLNIIIHSPERFFTGLHMTKIRGKELFSLEHQRKDRRNEFSLRTPQKPNPFFFFCLVDHYTLELYNTVILSPWKENKRKKSVGVLHSHSSQKQAITRLIGVGLKRNNNNRHKEENKKCKCLYSHTRT